MTRVFLADRQPEVRLAMRLLVQDLKMQVVGNAADWPTTLSQAFGTQPDMLVVDWELIPHHASLRELRATFSAPVVIVLISHMDARKQAALSAGADSFISKGDTPNRLAERLQAAAANIIQPQLFNTRKKQVGKGGSAQVTCPQSRELMVWADDGGAVK